MPAQTTRPNNPPEHRIIAVVDDDEPVRAATTRLLRSLGFRVRAFATAGDFIGRSDPREIECLVLDVQMPGINGLELQAQLTASGHRLPIIFITGSDDAGERNKAFRAGAVAYLKKPFSDEALVTAIRAALKPSASRAQDTNE